MAGVSSPLQLFGDFGIAGGQDLAPNPLQNEQVCINFYPEVNKQNAKEVLGLLGCPGLIQLAFAPGGGVPTAPPLIPSGTLKQAFEINMASPTWPTNVAGSSPQNTPVILSVSPTIDVIDRNYVATTYGASGGDGNVYHYSVTTGALSSTTLQSAAPTSYQNWQFFSNHFGGWTLSNASTVGPALFVLATSDGNNVFARANDTLGTVTHFASNTSASYSSGGVFVYDFGALLFATSGFTSSDAIWAVFPCADYKHVIAILATSGTVSKWAILNCIHGSEAVVSHGTILDATTQDTVSSGFMGGSNSIASNNITGAVNGARAMGCLQSDLQTLWVIFYDADSNGSGKCQIAVLSVNSSTFDLKISLGVTGTHPTAFGTPAFPNTNASQANNNLAASIWADNGTAAILAGQGLTVWSFAEPVTVLQWPHTSTVTNLPVRGMWELPNDNTALAVIGNTCFLVKVVTPATSMAFATFSLTSVGTLLTNIGPVSIRDNNAGGYAVIVDGPYGYLYNISSQVFTQITDPAFLGADTVAFIDGWWVFNQYSTNGSQTFYTNFPQYSTTFNGSYFALKDGAADNLRAVFENKEQLWLLGDKTTEIWYDAGGQYFAFQRLVGTMLQYGCKAAHSVARFYTEGQDGVIWFGRSERGENVILRSRGFTIDTVSTPGFSNEVSQYPIVNDAIGYTYQEDTHEFYVLIFPTADTTWCYDAQSGLLHKRLSYDPYLQKYHRHRSNCFMNFQGMRIVGDYQCGSLYQLTRNAFTDAGWPILAKRRSPHVWDKGQRGRVFMASLQIDFRQGVGNANGLGTNPVAGLAISRDGGKTFGQRWYSPIGQIGQYKNRTMWRKLAFGRDNVVDIEVIDPVPRDIIGVTLKAFSSA